MYHVRPSSQKIIYRIRFPYFRKFDQKVFKKRKAAINYALKILDNYGHVYGFIAFVEIYRTITSDWYEPVNELVCKIKNI